MKFAPTLDWDIHTFEDTCMVVLDAFIYYVLVSPPYGAESGHVFLVHLPETHDGVLPPLVLVCVVGIAEEVGGAQGDRFRELGELWAQRVRVIPKLVKQFECCVPPSTGN